jgi:hypothetical protein
MIKLLFQYRSVAVLTFCLLQLSAVSVVAQNVKLLQPAPAPTFSFVPAQDGAPGSTMTLQQLQQAQKKSEELPAPLQVQPAGEPSPALKYRLYPARWELKPGSALLHYARAQILYLQMPAEKRDEWNEWLADENSPTADELAAAVASLQNVLNELHELAMSEDFAWDHRIRDLRGPEVYMYMLPDVQETRAMLRLLQLKIKLQLKQRDFDGAISSFSDGFRLAEFVGQGETLIQKLVGISIANIMRDGIQEMISTPGCPNLYWALASIPQPLVNVSESLLWELHSIYHVLPMLAMLTEAETAHWSDDEASRKWAQLVDDLAQLDENESSVRVSLTIAAVTQVDVAKARLLAAGESADRLAKLPAMQIVLLDAAVELRTIGDNIGKGHLLPFSVAKPLLEQEEARFQDWVQKNRTTSVGAIIARLLFSVMLQAKQAETRMLMNHNRLMTLEAIRMHAAEHDGELPKSLDELSPVPAMPDPSSGKAFEYSIQSAGEQETIVLKAADALHWKQNQEFRATFVK